MNIRRVQLEVNAIPHTHTDTHTHTHTALDTRRHTHRQTHIHTDTHTKTLKYMYTFTDILYMYAGISAIFSSFSSQLFIIFPAEHLMHTIYVDNRTVKFDIWDIAGQERYRSLTPMYYRDAQAAMVVYDITNMVRHLLSAIKVG